ncbi:MAG: BTAD domain-containing putative transcriptional regulator, partial [Acidimicrobiales bacterium]|nr:BTAD domain-containing putative transcriptional regulator [Acidimicrobiales bacterium]
REGGDLAQLGYVSGIADDNERLGPLIARMFELSEQGCAAARPFLDFASAWIAMGAADPHEQLAAAQRIDDVEIPESWRLVRRWLLASALLALGRPDEASGLLPEDLAAAGFPVPGALSIGDQLDWLCGRPEQVVARGPAALGAEFGARDRYVAGVWGGVAYSFAGRSHDAVRALRIARESLGHDIEPFWEQQLRAVEALPALARGDEAHVAEVLRDVLVSAGDLDDATVHMLSRWCALPYVLVPESRPRWDQRSLGPCFAVARDLAATLVAYREHGDLAPARLLRWPEPGLVAASLPVAWMVELGLIGELAGAPSARAVTAWACGHWGAPAREALRGFARGDRGLAATARAVLAETPMPPRAPVTIEVLGPMRLLHGGHVSTHPDWRRTRVRALLLHLILDGPATRERIAASLWPDFDSAKADKNLRSTLSYLHQALEPMRLAHDAPWFVRDDGTTLSLHASASVDVWDFDRWIDEATGLEAEGRPLEALDRYFDAVALWRGDVAEGDNDHVWADHETTRLRSRMVRAATRCAELLTASGRADESLDVAHRALGVDPWFARAHVSLIRAYVQMGDRSSARAMAERARETLGDIGVDLDLSGIDLVE